MARRRKISSDGSGVPKKAKPEPKAPRGRETPVKRSIPFGAIAFVVLIVFIVALMVTMRPVDDGDDDDEPVLPTELTRTFQASLSDDSVFLLTGRNETIQITVNNSGDLDDDYDITVHHSDELDIDVRGSLSLDTDTNQTFNVTIGSVGTTDLYNVTINITVDIPEDEANSTGENVTIVNQTTQVRLDLTVYVSEFNLGIIALDDHEVAAPGESVIFVFEIENNGTLDTAVDLTVSKLTVDGGGKGKWTGAAQLDVHQMALFENDITHVRLNVTVPHNADPDGEVAHFTIEAESVDALAAGVPLVVSTEVHLTVSNIGFFGFPDAYEKEVQEDTWVRFDCQIWNSGGTDVHVKYHISEIPVSWGTDLQPYPEEGWYLGDDPVTFYIEMKPIDVELGEYYRFIVEIYSDDTTETSSFSINMTIAEPRFQLVTESQYIPIDLEIFDQDRIIETEMIVANLGLLSYQVNLSLRHPPGWDMDIDPGWVELEPYTGTDFEVVTLRFLMPTNTTPEQHSFTVVGEAWGVELELNLIADVGEYRNGTVELGSPSPQLHLPQPPPNGSSDGFLEFNITNTGNIAANFEIFVQNHQELDRHGWKFNLTSGPFVEDNRLVIPDLDPGMTVVVYLNVKVEEVHDGDSIDPSLVFSVHRSPVWTMDQIDCVVFVD